MLEWLCVLAFPVALFGGVGALVYRRHLAKQAFLDALREAGYQVTSQPRGFTVDGGERVPWRLVQHRGRGNNASIHATWTTPAEPIERVVAVLPDELAPGRHTLAALPDGIFNSSLAQMLLRALFGPDAAQLAQVRVVTVADAAFAEVFTVLSDDEEVAHAFLTDGVRAALIHAALPDVAVLRWRDRLELRQLRPLQDVRRLQAIVQLGERLADAVGYGAD